MNKNKIKHIKTPWYISFINWSLNALSYYVKVTDEPFMHKVVEVDVVLNNGKKGIVSFDDYFDVDQDEGKYSLVRTGLKKYQNRAEQDCFQVRFSETEGDWRPVYSSSIVSWGEPTQKTKIYPWRLYAIKVLGLTLKYESRLIKYCDD